MWPPGPEGPSLKEEEGLDIEAAPWPRIAGAAALKRKEEEGEWKAPPVGPPSRKEEEGEGAAAAWASPHGLRPGRGPVQAPAGARVGPLLPASSAPAGPGREGPSSFQLGGDALRRRNAAGKSEEEGSGSQCNPGGGEFESAVPQLNNLLVPQERESQSENQVSLALICRRAELPNKSHR